MKKLLRDISEWVVGLFVKPRKKNKERKFPNRDEETYRFKARILDELDDYFVILKKMKKGDGDAYDLFKRVGAYVMPTCIEAEWYKKNHQLNSWWGDHRPTFGAFFWGFYKTEDRETKDWLPVFLYFQKYNPKKSPLSVERVSSGDVYVVTIYWDNLKDKEISGAPTSFPIWIAPDGKMKLLKTKLKDRQVVTPKRGASFTIPHHTWGNHSFFEEMANKQEEEVGDFLIGMFGYLADLYSTLNHDMAKIHVIKKSVKAVFGIDILKTPYFFLDRETVTVQITGKKPRRKPIFHIVRTHPRVVNGNTIHIGTHFRGHKNFIWNGYSVSIRIPGWHHINFDEFDVQTQSIDRVDLTKEYWDSTKLGDTLAGMEKAEGRRVEGS